MTGALLHGGSFSPTADLAWCSFACRVEWPEFLAGYGLVQETLAALTDLDRENTIRSLTSNMDEAALKQLHEVYNAMDLDHSGAVEDTELALALKKELGYSKQQVKAFLAAIDVDGNRKISFEEFQMAQVYFTDPNMELEKLKELPDHTHRTLTKQQIVEASAVFKSFDINDSGSLSHHELAGRLSDIGMSDEEVELMILEMDGNHDGLVDFDEFVAVFMDYIPFEEEILADK